MKTKFRVPKASLVLLSVGLMVGVIGCSSAPQQSPGEGAESVGAPPVVVNPRAEPKKIVLTENFETVRPLEVFADIKSFDSGLDKVRLRLFFSPETEEKLKFFR